MSRHPLLLYLLVTAASSAGSAAPSQAPVPPPLAFAAPAVGITVTSDVQYGMAGSTRLAMDVYRPAPGGGARGPALIFFNRATGADRSDFFYAAWARAAASKGIVAILPDLRDGSEAADFRVLISYLEQHGSEHGIDAIAVYAGSGNVSAAFPAVEDPAQKTITAAVMYYGAAPIMQFRLDLPVLYVRAGLDRTSVNTSIASLATTAVAQNAPFTLLNYTGGHHAFEMVDLNAATREVIDQTLEYVKRMTSATYQAALHATLAEATAAGYLQTRKFPEAAAEFARILATRPGDARIRLSYGEALLGDAQFAAACAEFDKLRGKGLGARDLGLPAARACAQKGDAEAAVAWLNSIPARYLPASVAEDPAFAPLQSRADFRAIFARR